MRGGGHREAVGRRGISEEHTGEPDWPRWLGTVEQRYDQVEATLRGHSPFAVPLAVALAPYWLATAQISGGLRWLRTMLSEQDLRCPPGSVCADPTGHAELLSAGVELALCHGEYADAVRWSRRANVLLRAAGQADGGAHLRQLGRVALATGERGPGRRLLSRAVDRCAAAADVMRESETRLDLAGMWLDQADPAAPASDLARSALAGYWERADVRGVARSRRLLAEAAAIRGQFAEATPLIILAMRALVDVGDRASGIEALEVLALCLGGHELSLSIVEHLGAARMLRGRAGMVALPRRASAATAVAQAAALEVRSRRRRRRTSRWRDANVGRSDHVRP